MLESGLYSLQIGYGFPEINSGARIDNTAWFGPLEISWDYHNEKAPFLGMFGPPATGKLISEIVQGKVPHIDPQPFSPARFH